MGNNNSTSVINGSVKGAVPKAIPSSSATESPNIPSLARQRQLTAAVPPTVRGVTNGKQVLEITFEGKPHKITIPKGLKAGDNFRFAVNIDGTQDVYASTLHTIPGMDIIHAKAVVYGSISVYNYSQGSQSAARQVGGLIQRATDAVRREAIEQGCNAVLGITYNVTNDSSGEYGREKTVVVTATGTPCVVVPSRTAVATASAAQGQVVAGLAAPSAPPIPTVTAQAYVP